MTTRATTLSALEIAERFAEADVPLQMDEDAFRGFYERTSRPLWAYLQRLAGDSHAADDLLQEAYYRFLRADPVADDESHRRRYLFRIATNLVNDRFRRSRVRPIEVHHDTDTFATQPADVTLNRRMDVGRALNGLGKRERAMLWLAYVQGASHQEIAGVLELSPASVKTLLFRARRRLAGLLGRGKEDA